MPIEQQPRPSKRDLAYDYEDNKLLLKSEYQKSLHKLEQLQLNADERLEELYAEYVQLNGSANGLDTGGTQLTQFKGLKALTNKIKGPKTVDVNTRLQTIRSQYIQLINVTNEIETYLDSAHSIAEFDSSQNPTLMSDVKALIDIKAQEKVEKNKVKEHHKKLKAALEIASTHKQKVARVAESVRGIPPMDVFAQTQTPPQPSLPSYLIDSTPPPSGRLSDEQLQKIINPNPEAKPFTLPTPTPESDITTLASDRLQNAELQTTKVEIIDKKSLAALASDEIKPVNPLIQKVIYNNTRGLEIGLDKDNKVIAFHTREGQSPVPLTFKFISNKIILSEPNPVVSYTVFNIQDRVREQKAKVLIAKTNEVTAQKNEISKPSNKIETSAPITKAKPVEPTAEPEPIPATTPQTTEVPATTSESTPEIIEIPKPNAEETKALDGIFRSNFKDFKLEDFNSFNTENLQDPKLSRDAGFGNIKLNDFATSIPYSVNNLRLIDKAIKSGELVKAFRKNELQTNMNQNISAGIDYIKDKPENIETKTQTPKTIPSIKSNLTPTQPQILKSANLELSTEVNDSIDTAFGVTIKDNTEPTQDEFIDNVDGLEASGRPPEIETAYKNSPELFDPFIDSSNPIIEPNPSLSIPALIETNEVVEDSKETTNYSEFEPLVEAIKGNISSFGITRSNQIKKITIKDKELTLEIKGKKSISINRIVNPLELATIKNWAKDKSANELKELATYLNTSLLK